MNIGLDVDEVCADFLGGVLNRASERGLSEHFPKCRDDITHWNVCDGFLDLMHDTWQDVGFWLKLKPSFDPKTLQFKPDCYVTARRIDSWVTEQWLATNKFPKAPVITVENPLDKLVHIKERNLDIFVDDHVETVRHLRQNGVNAVLYEAPHQRDHFHEDLPKIKHLGELCK